MLKHPYLKKVQQLNLFRGIHTFKELERRILEHSEFEKEQGDAFEVFAEAFLKLGFNAPYKSVLPENAITADHFKTLRLKPSSRNVKGIDGILETHSGELHTYQVKFRSREAKLSWNECVGSVAASTEADSLLVFTNVEEIDGDIKKRNVYSVTHNFLSLLTSNDFQKIENLIYAAVIEPKKIIDLEPYQEDAVQSVLDSLKKEERTQVIMPCGSGKTIVGQRIIERMESANIILILVPTLQLLNDTFEDYIKNTIWKTFPYICVGSKVLDASSHDQIDLDTEDLPFVSCTDPKPIKKFLDRKSGTKIVFSTYQSLPVFAKALGSNHVDVAIFDEAHNTASKKGNHWSFGLEDKNIKINKRIFLTATPRKFHLLRKNEDLMRSVFSMDDPSTYGKIAYQLTFKKAAYEYEVICKYKIIISVINSEYYTKDDLKSAGVLVGYSEVNAETIAKQIALLDAVKKNEIKKIISFHPKISHASEFVGEKDKSIRHRLDGFNFYTISSKQGVADRRTNMRSFRNSKKALISNAQCLNEGVDVPAVDMVAFMHPKRSTISIVQAVGRAIRKPRGSNKEWGYVFVPIFLEKNKNETDLEAAQRSNFKDVYEVINALRDHDEVLDDIIKKLKIEKGRSGDFEGSALDDRIQINGTGISIEEIKSFVQSEIVDQMAPSWYEFYGKLQAYHDKYGDTLVSAKTALVPSLKRLGQWVEDQRKFRKRGTLSKKRIVKLDSLGFVWDVKEAKWDLMFQRLVTFKERHGHMQVYSNQTNVELKELAIWISTQRKNKKGSDGFWLPNDKIKRLNSIAFDWDPMETKSKMNLDKMRKFEKEHGHCRVPRHYVKDPSLGKLVGTLRSQKKKGILSPEIIKQYDEIGFEWEVGTFKKNYFEKLFQYYQKYGHCKVPKNYPEDPAFGNWVHRQRIRRTLGIMSEKTIKKLEKIGFTWDARVDTFEDMYDLLIQFKDTHGHLEVIKKDDVKLYNWCSRIRSDHQNEKLAKEKIKLLLSIGFDFNPKRTKWFNNFEKLKAAKKEQGNFNFHSRLQVGLYNLVARLKKQKSAGTLSKEYQQLLDEIGFVWE